MHWPDTDGFGRAPAHEADNGPWLETELAGLVPGGAGLSRLDVAVEWAAAHGTDDRAFGQLNRRSWDVAMPGMQALGIGVVLVQDSRFTGRVGCDGGLSRDVPCPDRLALGGTARNARW